MLNDRTGERPTVNVHLMRRIAVGTTVLAAALAVGLLACGCGGEKSSDKPVASQPSEQTFVVAQAGGGTQSPTAAVGTLRAEQPAVPADSLSPDIAVSVGDTLVAAGNRVEITGESSADVVTMALADGIHQQQLFTFDPTHGVWRTVYRVPLRPQSDRLALSVTARNGAGRWRRVWVFLRLHEEQAGTPADTTVGK
jgi:hypothetical protein